MAGNRASNNLPHILVAAGILLVGSLAAWQTSIIPKSAIYATVGPHIFPWIITVFLIILGIGLMIAALRGGWAHEQDGTITEFGSLGFVIAGLVLNAALIEHIGFILASTLMFTLVARGFGSRQILRDAAIGFTLAFISYVGFDRVLSYKIGSGWIESLI
jgi:putative tricarboxylic transport membrane protein